MYIPAVAVAVTVTVTHHSLGFSVALFAANTKYRSCLNLDVACLKSDNSPFTLDDSSFNLETSISEFWILHVMVKLGYISNFQVTRFQPSFIGRKIGSRSISMIILSPSTQQSLTPLSFFVVRGRT